MQEVAQWPLVTYDQGLTGRKQIDRAFEKLALKPRIAMAAIDSDVIKTYVGLGLGVGIIAGMAFDPHKDSGLSKVCLKTRIESSQTCFGLRRRRFRKDYVYRFIEMCAPAVTKAVILQAEAQRDEIDGAI